jgi:hypothetical protein
MESRWIVQIESRRRRMNEVSGNLDQTDDDPTNQDACRHA